MSLDRRLDYHAHAGTQAPSPGPAGACGALPNAQWVDNLVIRSDQLLETEAVPLRVQAVGTGTCHLPPATRHLPPATRHLPPATGHLPPATRHLPPATCHLPR